MKPIFLLLLLAGFCSCSFAQKQFKVIFHDTTNYNLANIQFVNDTTKQDNDFNKLIAKAVLEKMQKEGITRTNDRVVTTHDHYTVIKIDRSTIDGGEVTFNGSGDLFDSLLFKADELYEDAPTSTGFTSTPVSTPKKIFRQTGSSKTILGYLCYEFTSTDSSCLIWVTDKLPPSINPGVRLTNLKVAVLRFELRQEQSYFKTEAVKIE